MNTDQRPTPDTDTASFWGRDMGADNGPPHFQCVDAEFARRLESERDDLKAWKESALAVDSEWDVQELAKMLGCQPGQSCRRAIHEGALKLLHEIDSLKRERDESREENAAMREAIKEAHAALKNACSYPVCGSWNEQAEEALTKLQQFLK